MQNEYHDRIRTHLRTAYLLSEEKIESVLPRFLETIRNLLGELEDLAVSEGSEALSRAGHAMKGALLNLGLPDLAEKAFCIEKHRERNGTAGGNCVRLVEELSRELRKII